MVIADRIGAAINPVLANVSESTGVSLALSIILYSIQLYADFSGCIDMARGASCMLGIDLDKNFDRPYFSKNMPEFWRRWHISLFGWFKDYLLYPVSISKLSKKLGKFFRHTKSKRAGRLVVSAVCLLVVWLATGLWHGAYWTFILWGLFHGVLLFLSQLTEPWIAKINTKLKVRDSAFGIRFLRCLRTFFLCCVGRIFFRAATVEDSFTMFRKIFGEFNFADFATVLKAMKLSIPNMLVIVAGIIILFVVSLLQRKGELRPRINAKPFPLRWAVLIFLIFGTLIFGMYGVGFSASNFLYANF
ncbi:MAG: hypothetical protein HUJ75_05185 [Parasporobacterium sp.]|nr:hypothetical protein [Parasporobacterium sp.]